MGIYGYLSIDILTFIQALRLSQLAFFHVILGYLTRVIYIYLYLYASRMIGGE